MLQGGCARPPPQTHPLFVWGGHPNPSHLHMSASGFPVQYDKEIGLGELLVTNNVIIFETQMITRLETSRDEQRLCWKFQDREFRCQIDKCCAWEMVLVDCIQAAAVGHL